jgi:hypothetical protein
LRSSGGRGSHQILKTAENSGVVKTPESSGSAPGSSGGSMANSGTTVVIHLEASLSSSD